MAGSVVPAPLQQLPNALTIARLVLIPVFVVLFVRGDDGYSWPAAIVFGVAGITDQVDGFLARRWHVESEFGKVADPLADRLMIDVAVVLLCVEGRLPWLALGVILARDALLIGGYKVVVPRGYEFSVSFVGKAATWVLYASIGFLMVTHSGTTWPVVLFWSGIVLALVAASSYVLAAWRSVRGTAVR